MNACSDSGAPADAAAAAAADGAAAETAIGDGQGDSAASDTLAAVEVLAQDSGIATETLPDVSAPLDVKPDVPAEVQQSETAKLMACLFKNCVEQITGCLTDEGCGAAVGCLAGCGGDSGCMLNCGAGLPTAAQQQLTAVATCAIQQGCVQIIKSPNCGNGKCDFGEQLSCAQDCGTQSAVCGDGKCDVSEVLSCDKDCKPATPCGDGTCDAKLENPLTCPKDCPAPKCGDGKCAIPFETVLTCAQDCTPTIGCGDGACDPATETTLTCALDCSGLLCGDAKCSFPLENAFTCAKDCPLPACGDAKCETPFESPVTCAIDCSVNGGTLPSVASCVASKCSKESIACVGDFTGCGSGSLCVGGCKDFKCVVNCGTKLSGASAQKFTALKDCIGKNCVSP
ncbi:MAG: hypothetical protein EXR77_19380 [Myxococcales bacterium]|nr:hypothetical protein [Myxococcales bacterium]